MSDTQPATFVVPSPDTDSFEEDYAQWDRAHARMKSAPSKQGRDYIKHAANLLMFLEPICELNPIAKAVVGVFKLVVSFEQDRQENDARIEAVVLAQTDLMRVFLDVDKITKRNANTSEALYTVSSIKNIFEDIEKQINLCHNCMDTYREQQRIAKLFKAREWKEKFMKFTSIFDGLRSRLLTALNIQTASNVSEMVTEYKEVLNQLFSAQNPKEKEDLKKINKVGRETLLRDPKAVQSLIVFIEDSSTAENIAETAPKVKNVDEKRGASKPDAKKIASVNIELQARELQESMRASVDDLCEKHRKHFEKVMAFYTDHLRKSIDDSAERVIRSLSGPYDRLLHEDLRELWKEMKWIFCVETNIFVMALFEYYQDLYTHPQVVTTDPDEETGAADQDPQSTSKTSLGPKPHPDAWTLPYLKYFTSATATIDDDNSGFIRISEANRFTSRIPEGWTLPQYCAYLVEGRHHENAIYRHRMLNLRNNLHEMHARLLPWNRYAANFLVEPIFQNIIDRLTLCPKSRTNAFSIAPELHELIQNRILKQDRQVRETDLDPTMVDMLFRGQDLEQYIFPLAYALMELLLDFHYLCCSSTIDIRQWTSSITRPFKLLYNKMDDHVKELKRRDPKIDLVAYHRGIWYWFDLPPIDDMTEEQEEEFNDAVVQDIYLHQADTSFTTDFPLPALVGDRVTRKYPTWEEFSEKNDTSRLPEDHFLLQWGDGTDDWDPTPDYMEFLDLPRARLCDKCRRRSRDLKTAFYYCLECDDFDICQDCYDQDPTEHEAKGHQFSHTVALAVAFLQESRCVWIHHQNEREKERYLVRIQEIQMPQLSDESDSDHDGDEEDSRGAIEEHAGVVKTPEPPVDLEKEMLDVCSVCQACVTLEYADHDALGGHTLCQKCALAQHDNVDTHFWWHSLLPIDKRVLYLGSDASSESDSLMTPPQTNSLDASDERGGPIQDVPSAYDTQEDKSLANGIGEETKVSAVEKRVVEIHSVLYEFAQETSEGLAKFDTLNARLDAFEERVGNSLAGLETVVTKHLLDGGRDGDNGTEPHERPRQNTGLGYRMAALESSMSERLSGIELMLKQLLSAGGGSAPPGANPSLPPMRQGLYGQDGSQNEQFGHWYQAYEHPAYN